MGDKYLTSTVKDQMDNIFDKDVIDILLKLKWWDKDIETIKKIIPLLEEGTINIEKLKSYIK